MNDVLKLFKSLGLNVQTKANEVIHTGNSGAGQEFVPLEVFKSEVIDIVPQRARLLPLLPGNHGVNLPKKYTAAARGISVGDLEFEGKGEWTTGTASSTQSNNSQLKPATQQVSISQAQFIAEVDISDEELKYNAVNTEDYVKARLAEGMAYTVDSIIINGDNETGGTGNVNLVDAAPNSKKYYLKIDHGIRELAINNSYKVNVGTLAAADYADLLKVLGQYAERPEDCLFIQSAQVTNKAIQIAEFMTMQNSGDKASIQSGLRPTPFGVQMLTHRAIKKAQNDGTISNTAGNNTLGQIALIYKGAVQYGFGQDFNLEVVRVPGYGFRLVATFDFGFTIIDAGASLTDPTVALGYNVTI